MDNLDTAWIRNGISPVKLIAGVTRSLQEKRMKNLALTVAILVSAGCNGTSGSCSHGGRQLDDRLLAIDAEHGAQRVRLLTERRAYPHGGELQRHEVLVA